MTIDNSSSVLVSAKTHHDYRVRIERGCLAQIPHWLAEFDPISAAVLITDRNVDAIYAAALEAAIANSGRRTLRFVMDPSRQKKNLDTACEIFALLFDQGVDRDALILIVGGGTVGDLGGLVAALYLRGVRYIHVPTTLIGQADSSIGGKVNANFGPYLNSISVFHHPAAIWIDPDALNTLPRPEYRSGLGEVVKYAAAMDSDLFTRLEAASDALNRPDFDVVEELVEHCVRRKAEIVSGDSQEAGRFQLFNYGHEFGHALEATYNFTDLLHGEAVTIGMHASAWVAWQAGLAPKSVFQRQSSLLRALRLPRQVSARLRSRIGTDQLRESVASLLGSDKKRRSNGQVWIMPRSVGVAVATTEVPAPIIAEAIRRIADGKLPL